LESNRFAAQYVARAAANELEARWRSVEQVSDSGRLLRAIKELTTDREISVLLARLSDPQTDADDLETLQREFREHPKRQEFQRRFEQLVYERHRPPSNSWFVTDTRGVQLVRLAENPLAATEGKNYSWRGYFTGHGKDMPPSWRPKPDEHIDDTTLSHVYLSQATNSWMVAVSTPIEDDDSAGTFRGVVGLTIEVGRFVEMQGRPEQFAVLVDWRDGENKGVLLQHPLFNKLRDEQGVVPERFRNYRVARDVLPTTPERMRHYPDPVAADPDAAEYRRQWLAQMEPVQVRGQSTGWLVVVQEAYDTAIGAPLERLESGLVRYGLLAVGLIVAVILALWGFAVRLRNEASPPRKVGQPALAETGSGSGGVAPDRPTETFR